MRIAAMASVLLLSLACGEPPIVTPGDPPGPDPNEEPKPPPGPQFSVSPIPLDKIARISPLGPNNKIFPVGHTYWDTCDGWYLLPTSRPCLLERLPIRAPAAGVIRGVVPGDGNVTIEGPPGLFVSFGHVTPVPGLAVGAAVRAGDTVATMFYEHSFDFGVLNNGLTPHIFVNEARVPRGYTLAQSPIDQFAGQLRTDLLSRVSTAGDPLGRISYDVDGTASGLWFKEGTPQSDLSFTPEYIPAQLFLGRLVERQETRILVVGDPFPGQPARLHAIDAAAPSWEDLTPASGPVQFRLWNFSPDGRQNLTFPLGSMLVEVVDGRTARIEWFDTHGGVAGFGPGARIYER